jgi:hypothetical protein
LFVAAAGNETQSVTLTSVVVVMLYELAVQDLARTHFASFSVMLNLSLYAALTL